VAVTCRDTCDMTCLLECDTYMYAASANGALRKWSLPFDPTKVEFRGQMWMHNKVRVPLGAAYQKPTITP